MKDLSALSDFARSLQHQRHIAGLAVERREKEQNIRYYKKYYEGVKKTIKNLGLDPNRIFSMPAFMVDALIGNPPSLKEYAKLQRLLAEIEVRGYCQQCGKRIFIEERPGHPVYLCEKCRENYLRSTAPEV